MKVKTILKRTVTILLSVFIGTSCIATAVFALGNIDTSRKTSLTVYFGENGTGFPNVDFRFYRVANMSDTGSFTLWGDFHAYPVSLENLDSSGWRALAQTLYAYVKRDNLQPLRTGKTNSDGLISFSELTVGLYLVTGDMYTKEGTTYTPEPMLVSLPGLTAGDEWDYDVEVSCKYDSGTIPALVERKVQKVWKDDGNEDKRPEAISVQLLENGSVVATVTLSEENNWEYTWNNLNGSSTWQIAEAETPEGYTVTVAQEGITFIMTNTFPPETPPKLPQTGMLWWPVPLLVCGGLLLVVIGLFVGRKQVDKNEK